MPGWQAISGRSAPTRPRTRWRGSSGLLPFPKRSRVVSKSSRSSPEPLARRRRDRDLALLHALGGDLDRSRMLAAGARDMLETLREGSVLSAIPAFWGGSSCSRGRRKPPSTSCAGVRAPREDGGALLPIVRVGTSPRRSTSKAGSARRRVSPRPRRSSRARTTSKRRCSALRSRADPDAEGRGRVPRKHWRERPPPMPTRPTLSLAQGNALAVLAEALQGAGCPAEAAAALEEAIRLYELKGSVSSAARCALCSKTTQVASPKPRRPGKGAVPGSPTRSDAIGSVHSLEFTRIRSARAWVRRVPSFEEEVELHSHVVVADREKPQNLDRVRSDPLRDVLPVGEIRPERLGRKLVCSDLNVGPLALIVGRAGSRVEP